MIRRPPRSTLFPYTTPSDLEQAARAAQDLRARGELLPAVPSAPPPAPGVPALRQLRRTRGRGRHARPRRSEEHTSELQSRQYLVCRLLLEKKKTPNYHCCSD